MLLPRKVDLVMWSKHGPPAKVMERIRKVIPKNVVAQKILVIDNFEDLKDASCFSYGWKVVTNQGKGISGAANTALCRVKAKYFISFEDDILIAENWWKKVPELLFKQNVAIASGIRLADKPECIRKLQEYIHQEKYRKRYEKNESFIRGKSLDNTIYKTEIMKKIGFPSLSVAAGVDTVLEHKIYEYGYRWLVDYDVVSIHLRNFRKIIKNYYWYGKCQKGIAEALGKKQSVIKTFLTTLISPLIALEIANKINSWKILGVYPLIRSTYLIGCIVCYLKD